MSTPKRRFNLLSLTFIVLCFKKSLLIRTVLLLLLSYFYKKNMVDVLFVMLCLEISWSFKTLFGRALNNSAQRFTIATAGMRTISSTYDRFPSQLASRLAIQKKNWNGIEMSYKQFPPFGARSLSVSRSEQFPAKFNGNNKPWGTGKSEDK